MKVNLDNLRRQTTQSMNRLGDKIKDIVNELPSNVRNYLIEAFDAAARNVDMFNSCYSSEDEMFSDLSDEIEVRQIGESDSDICECGDHDCLKGSQAFSGD